MQLDIYMGLQIQFPQLQVLILDASVSKSTGHALGLTSSSSSSDSSLVSASMMAGFLAAALAGVWLTAAGWKGSSLPAPLCCACCSISATASSLSGTCSDVARQTES